MIYHVAFDGNGKMLFVSQSQAWSPYGSHERCFWAVQGFHIVARQSGQSDRDFKVVLRGIVNIWSCNVILNIGID
jgi:hypothetical protein